MSCQANKLVFKFLDSMLVGLVQSDIYEPPVLTKVCIALGNEATHLLHLANFLNSLSASCMSCLVQDFGHCSHTLTRCPQGLLNMVDLQWLHFKNLPKFKAPTCYGCGLSLKVSTTISSMCFTQIHCIAAIFEDRQGTKTLP
jgi:hypothetical protein